VCSLQEEVFTHTEGGYFLNPQNLVSLASAHGSKTAFLIISWSGVWDPKRTWGTHSLTRWAKKLYPRPPFLVNHCELSEWWGTLSSVTLPPPFLGLRERERERERESAHAWAYMHACVLRKISYPGKKDRLPEPSESCVSSLPICWGELVNSLLLPLSQARFLLSPVFHFPYPLPFSGPQGS
jgi:hypothetical protein